MSSNLKLEYLRSWKICHLEVRVGHGLLPDEQSVQHRLPVNHTIIVLCVFSEIIWRIFVIQHIICIVYFIIV